MTSPNEEFRYDVIIDAKVAIEAMKALLRATADNNEKITQFTKQVVTDAKKWGVSWQYALNVYKQLNAELGKNKKATLFGQTGGQDLMGMSEQYLKAADSAGILGKATAQVSEKTNKAGDSMTNAEKKAHSYRRSIDAVRVAMGTLVAMGIFRFFNFLETSVRKAIESFKQMEMALYQLGAAERALSEAGVDIAPEDFQAIIDSVRELFPFISKIDTTRMVSSLALLTKDLRLTKEQMEGLAKAVPILAVRGSTTIESATEQVVNGLTTSGRGWKDLGVQVDANIIKQEAVAIGLVRTIKAYEELTAEQKQQVEVMALLSLLNKSVNDEVINQDDYLTTLDATTRATSSTWEDFLAKLGEISSPAIIEGLKLLIYQLEAVNKWLVKNQESIAIVVAFFSGLISAYKALQQTNNELANNATLFDRILGVVSPAIAEMRKLGKLGGSGFVDSFMEGYEEAMRRAGAFGELGPDTPTNPLANLQDSIDTSKAQDQIESLLEDLEEMDRREAKVISEFNEKQARELQDHLVDMARDEQDYQIKRQRFIADSNKDIAEKQEEAREKEKNEEAKHLEELRQLRERFLFDLEDALRDRDARQVLRLIEKYRMDKQAMINEYNLRSQEEKKRNQDDIQQAIDNRNEKLRQMDEDHAIEMARQEQDYQLKAQRRQEDHEQELAELRAMRVAKMQETAAAIAEEFGLKAEGAQAIYELLNKYYGPGGTFDGLFSYSNRSLVASAEQMLATLAQIIAQYQSMTTTMPKTTAPVPSFVNPNVPASPGRRNRVPGMAQGGTLFADTPTTVRFGEAGPEMATFIPLSRMNSSLNQSGGQTGASGEGSVKIELLLSPDLEARVIENTLGIAGNIVARVTRSKP